MSRDLSRRDWQLAVKDQIREAVRTVLRAAGLQDQVDVGLVWNNTNRRVPTAPTRYFAKLDSAKISKTVRDAFSGFFRKANPLVRPPSLSNVSIRNKVTLATRVRLAILRQLGTKYKDSNPGSSFTVKGFESRPLLTIVPPPAAKDARQRTMNFIEAVHMLPKGLSDDMLAPIYRVVGSNFRGKLEATFVILRDDDHDRMLKSLREADQRARPGPGPSSALTYSGVVRQEGSGMELESGLSAALRMPPPPPPPLPPGPQVESPSVHCSPHPRSRGDGAKSVKASKKRKRRRSPSPPPKKSRRRRRSPSTSSGSSSSSSSTSSSSSSSNES